MKKSYRLLFLCIFLFLPLLLTSCLSNFLEFRDRLFPEDNIIEMPDPSDDPADNPIHTPKPSELENVKKTTSIKIKAVGDLLMHMPLVNASLKSDGTYDFTPIFNDIKPYLQDGDLVLANLETTISDPQHGYGGYPRFRTPEELLPALKESGFNIITTANNHTLDGKEFGVGHTLDKLDEYGLLHTGSARSQEERDRVLLVEKNEITSAVLAYTYGTNGMEVTIPGDKLPYMVNYIDRDLIRQDVERAKEAGADLIIVCIHWGDEYVRTPNPFQEETAEYLLSLGVDIIFGSHPHVLQPMERRKVVLEDGTEKEVFIIYSLGNFVSNQRDPYRDSGVIVNVEVIKDHAGSTISLGEITYTPTWVYKYSSSGGVGFRILPVGEYLEEAGGLNSEDWRRIRDVWTETTTHLGDSFKPIP